MEWRELDEAGRRAAINGYWEAHALYSRMILRMLVRVNRFEGDAEETLLRELPMLSLRRASPASGTRYSSACALFFCDRPVPLGVGSLRPGPLGVSRSHAGAATFRALLLRPRLPGM